MLGAGHWILSTTKGPTQTPAGMCVFSTCDQCLSNADLGSFVMLLEQSLPDVKHFFSLWLKITNQTKPKTRKGTTEAEV